MAVIVDIGGPRGTGRAQVKPNNRRPPGPLGNTVGLVVPDTAPAPHGDSAPPIEPTEAEKGWWGRWGGWVHTGLDVVGAIPVVGILGDAVNAGIYAAEGDYVNAGISGVSAAANLIPGGGAATKGAKLAVQGGKAVIKQAEKAAAEEAVRLAEKEAAEEAAKLAEKKAAQEIEEEGAKKANGRGGGKDKGKGKLKCGEGGKYGDLKNKTGDGKFDRDHIPSKAALKEKAKELNKGRELSSSQKKAIDDWGDAIAIPREAHQKISPTYGGRNKPLEDAKDLAGSAKRDVDAMLEKIEDYDEDGGCKNAYAKAAKKVLSMNNTDYADALKKILRSTK